MGVTVIRYSDRPELWEDTGAVSVDVWPEYNLHGDVLGREWHRLLKELPEFQFALYDEAAGEVLAEGHAAPCEWDGTTAALGTGAVDRSALSRGRRLHVSARAGDPSNRPPARPRGVLGTKRVDRSPGRLRIAPGAGQPADRQRRRRLTSHTSTPGSPAYASTVASGT